MQTDKTINDRTVVQDLIMGEIDVIRNGTGPIWQMGGVIFVVIEYAPATIMPVIT